VTKVPTPKVHVIHENAPWVVPLRTAFDALGTPFDAEVSKHVRVARVCGTAADDDNEADRGGSCCCLQASNAA
jgi:hypothetical protein